MKRVILILLAAALLPVAGCLISSQTLVEIDFSGTFNNGLLAESVNLADYDVTPADIQGIQKIDVDAIVVNALATADTVDVYLSANSTYTTRTQVKTANDVLPVLIGYITKPGPNGQDTLTVLEARNLLRFSEPNWTNLKNLVETGKFTVYVTSSGTAVQGQVVVANFYVTLNLKE